MIYLTKKWVRQNLNNPEFDPLFVKLEFSYSKAKIAGMISTDGSIGKTFDTKDNRHWLMFSVYKINDKNRPEDCPKDRRWILVVHDADDLYGYEAFIDINAVRERLYTFFDYSINAKYFNENYKLY